MCVHGGDSTSLVSTMSQVILRVIRTHYLLYAWFPHLAVNVIEKRFVWWMSQTNADFDPEDRGSRETVT